MTFIMEVSLKWDSPDTINHAMVKVYEFGYTSIYGMIEAYCKRHPDGLNG